LFTVLVDYAHLAGNGARLHVQLAPLAKLHGNAAIARWEAMLQAGETAELAGELLDFHYDPLYERAIRRNFPHYRNATVLQVDDAHAQQFHALARQLLHSAVSRAA